MPILDPLSGVIGVIVDNKGSISCCTLAEKAVLYRACIVKVCMCLVLSIVTLKTMIITAPGF